LKGEEFNMNHLLKKEMGLFTRGIMVVITFSCIISLSAYAGEPDNQRKHFLLLDDRIIANVDNAKLEVGVVKKDKSNPLFGEDQPWEKRFDNLYGNVIFDEEENLYKCWYSPFIVDYSAKGMSLEERDGKEYEDPEDREMGICYATSKDGIIWEKPNLGLVDYNGSKANNIVWRGPHGAGIFKDSLDPDPQKRYKTIFQGLQVSASSDGLHWEEPVPCEGVDVAGDTHNNAFWAPTLEKYVGITRSWGETYGRQVVRIESKDFITWTKEKVVLEGLDKNHQTYAMPVFFYGGIYIGLVAIHQQDADRVWTELTWSADTKNWTRISPGIPLIPCSDQKLDYDYGCVYPCAYPVFLQNEIRLYYGGSDYLHSGWRTGSLCLATLRPDGFAGYEQEANEKPGVVTTTVIPYAGQTIQVTADVEKDGWVKVSILNKDGNLIETAQAISTTVTDNQLSIQKKIDSNEVQLRFELRNAKIYSFKFVD
jgi:hypothetical protein